MDTITKKKSILKLLVSAVLVLCWGICFFVCFWFEACFAFYFVLFSFLCVLCLALHCVVSSFCLSIWYPLPRAAVGYMCLSYPLHWWGRREVGGRDGLCFVSLFSLVLLSLLSLGKFCTNGSYWKHKYFGKGYVRAGNTVC